VVEDPRFDKMQDEIISRRVLKMALGEKGFHRVIDSFAKVFQLEDSIRKKGQAPLSKGGNPAFARCQTTIGELLHDLSGSSLPVPKGSPPPSPHPNSKKKIIASNKYQLAPIDRVQDFLHIALKRMEDLSLRLAQQAEGDGRDKPPISEQKSDSSSNNNSAGAENKSSSAVKAGEAKTSTRVDPKFKKGNMVLYKGVKARVVGVHYESESYTHDCGSKRTPNVLFESANIKHLGRSKNTSNSSTGSGNTASRQQQQQQQQNNDEKNRIRNNKGNRTEGAGDEDEKSQNFETAEARVHVPKAGSAVTTATIGKELGKDWSLEIPGDTSLFGAVAVGHFLLGTCNKARREGKAVDVAAYISDFQRVCQRSNDNDPRPNFNSVLDVGDQFLRLFAQKAIMGNKEYLAKIKRDMNYVRRPTSKDVFSEYIKGLILKGDAAQDSKSNDDGHNNNGDDSTEDRKHASAGGTKKGAIAAAAAVDVAVGITEVEAHCKAFAHLGIRNSQPSLGLSRMLTAIASFVATPIRIDIDSKSLPFRPMIASSSSSSSSSSPPSNGTTEFLHLRWLSHKRRFAVVSNVPSPKTKDGGSIAKTKMPPLVRERKDGGGEAGGGGEGIKGRAMLPLVSPKKKVNGERKGDRETGHGRRDGYEEADDWNEYKRDRENDHRHRHRHRHRHLHHQRRQRGVREEDDHPPALAGMPSPPKLEKLRSRFHEEDGSLSDNFAGGDGRHGKENVGSHHYALGQSLPNHHQDGKSTDGGGGGGSPRSKPRSIERMESLPPRLVNQGGYTTTTGADEKADTSTAPPPLPSAAPEISTTSSTTMYREGESYLTSTTSSFEDDDTKQLFNPLQLTLDESIKDEDDSIIGVLDLGPRMVMIA